MIKVIYQGREITEDVSINACWHEMWAQGRADTLDIRFNDAAKLWDGWGAKTGDTIRVDYGAATTGTMFVRSVQPENGLFTIKAMSAPASGYAPRNKSWKEVKLTQIGSEIAGRHGLGFKSYGVKDQLYPYLLQEHTSDLAFLHRRAVLEGCCILVHDKTLILYDAAYMEGLAASGDLAVPLDGEFRYNDARAKLYGSCVVEHGLYKGEFSAGNWSSRILRPNDVKNIGSNAEAARYAKGLLRDANSGGMTGYVKTAGAMPGYAAASVAKLANERAPSWDGSVFLYRVRNDYSGNTSKLFFRKPLEGY